MDIFDKIGLAGLYVGSILIMGIVGYTLDDKINKLEILVKTHQEILVNINKTIPILQEEIKSLQDSNVQVVSHLSDFVESVTTVDQSLLQKIEALQPKIKVLPKRRGK